MLSGAGVLSALDIRTPNSSELLGGIYQFSTHIAGISGGLWLVANNILNDGCPIYDSIDDIMSSLATPLLEGVPEVDASLIRKDLDGNGQTPSSGYWNRTQLTKTPLSSTFLSAFFASNNESRETSSSTVRKVLDFYKNLSVEVRAKKNADFKVSLTDYWGRALTERVFPKSKRNIGRTFSSSANLASFRNHSQPFPILVSVERKPGFYEDSKDSHLFEFNIFESGSWDSYLNSFTSTKFLGTLSSNGVPTIQSEYKNFSVCVSGYDNFGLVTATSSSLFNTLFEYVYKFLVGMEQQSLGLFTQILLIFGIGSWSAKEVAHREYAVISPNPFYGTNCTRGRCISRAQDLYLADGGDDGQNIPFLPLMVRGRKVDVLFAFDFASELENFPNGTTLKRTADRFHADRASLEIPTFEYNGCEKRIFPYVPTVERYLKNRMRSRPIFFGCDLATDYPSIRNDTNCHHNFWEDYFPPLIIYAANHNYSYASNTSTFRTKYEGNTVRQMMTNGYNIATHGNSSEYRTCVGCAMLKRNADRNMFTLPDVCRTCFDKYCYHDVVSGA